MNTWKLLQSTGAWISIFAAVIFTGVGLLGIWGIVGTEGELITKSLSSLAIICFVGLVFYALGQLGENAARTNGTSSVVASVRNIVLGTMVGVTIPHAIVLLYVIWSDYNQMWDLFGKALFSFFVLLIGTIVVIKAIEVLDRKGTKENPVVISMEPPLPPTLPQA